jgi:DNA (cytosine-5)-methyltransferase 1
VPQHRERIFITAFRKDVGCNLADMVLPAQGPRLGSILHKTDGTEEDEPSFLKDGQVLPRYTLSEHLWEYLQRYKEKHAAKGNGFGYSLVGPDDVTRTLSARYHKDGSEILVRQEGNRPRRLTPRECARLMGFDRPTESNFVIPVSDTQAYRQFGNSVVVPCATAIAKHLQPYILQAVQQHTPAANTFAGKGQELKNSYATEPQPANG